MSKNELTAQYNAVVAQNQSLQQEIGQYRRIIKKIKEIEYVALRLRTKRDYHSPDEVNADIDAILNKCEVLQNGKKSS